MRNVRSQIANMITATRILFTIVILLLVKDYHTTGHLQVFCFMMCFICIAISDFFDGKIARKLQIASRFGAHFDVMADSFYVFSLHIQLFFQGIVPILFLLLMVEKTINYYITSYLIQKRQEERFAYIRDPIGKIVSASYFITPVVAVIVDAVNLDYLWLSDYLMLLLGGFGILSSIYRWHSVITFSYNKL